jgi:ATP-dependent DNA helicase RecQ
MEPSVLDRAKEALLSHFGYPDFRPGQWDIISSVLENRNTLAVLPTGGGKSLCYQIPAVMTPGLTIVVSPLISLMKDQVDALKKSGIRATAIHSSVNFREAVARLDKAKYGYYDLLYVAPERFESQAFLEHIRHISISLLAIDEAHCISEWGHNFRPSYRRLKAAIQFLENPTVLALTATATPDVQKDIVAQLELSKPNIVARGFNRPNLSFRVARDVQKRSHILDTCLKNESGIVYAGTRKSVQNLSDYLNAHGISAAPYHAGLTDYDRHEAQEKFLAGELRVIIATTAFGMGIDKADVRFVIHHDMPSSIEQYYQEAGRAGRDGKDSTCTMLHSASDRSLPEFFINSSHPDRSLIQEVYAFLHTMAGTQEGQSYDGLLNVSASSIASQLSVSSFTAVNTALIALEEHGYIRQVRATYSNSELRFHVSAERLRVWLTESADEMLQPVAVALLRSVGGEAFHYAVRFQLSDISEKSFISEEVLVNGMEEMKKQGLVSFKLGQRASGIALLEARVASKDLSIDYRRMDAMKKHQYRKLESVDQYINATTCRRNMILEYFEETGEGVCGICDNCISPGLVSDTEDAEASRLQRILLECTAELSGKFGKTTIVDVLRGAKTKRISQFHLYEADSYGAAERTPKSRIAKQIDALISIGSLAKTDSLHPTVHLTAFGKSKLRRHITPLNLPRFSSSNEVELKYPDLYERLRIVRRRLAGELNLPSHSVMNDTVLRAIANSAPESEPAFEAIDGVGPVTKDRCAVEMIKEVIEWKEKTAFSDLKEQISAKDAMPASIRATYNIAQRGLNLSEIADESGLTEGTVSGHIAEIITLGYNIDTTQLMPSRHRDQILKAIATLNSKELKKIKHVLDKDITFAEIRIALAELQRDHNISS